MIKILFFAIILIIAIIFQKDSEKQHLNTSIKILTRQAARWSTASKQDENAMIAVLHANYGAGYLWALKDIATASQIREITGIDIVKFEKEIIEIQDNATKKMIKLCPDYAPDKNYLTTIAGEG
tara:strand:+ start:382 stop:753 length:372 start_codon:yes stop_codon:yes gene_type:complete